MQLADLKHRRRLGSSGLRLAIALGLTLLTVASALRSESAWAGSFEADLEAARQAVLEGDRQRALTLIDAAQDSAPEHEMVVLGRQSSSLDFYRGVLSWQGGNTQGAMSYWRKALVVDPSFQVDTELLPEVDAQDLFEALRSELQQREMVGPGVEEDVGPRVYVSGQLMHSYDLLYTGQHLVQVLCSDGSLHGWWHDFGKAPDYAAACTAEPTQLADSATPESPTQSAQGPSRVLPLALLGGGVVLVGAGTASHLLLARPAYAQVEQARADPGSVDRTQADALSADFNRARWTTLGLLGVGAVALGAGASVSVMVDGETTGLVVSGAF